MAHQRVHVDCVSGVVVVEDLATAEENQLSADAAAGSANASTLATRSVNRSTLADRANNALATNANYLALASPSNLQVAAQVRALTTEASAIIRILIGALDVTD